MFDTTFIHPMVTHFPIALLIIGFLADAIGVIFKKDFFTKAAFYLLVLGAIGVVAAYITGENAGEKVEEIAAVEQALESHEEAAETTLILALITAVVRIIFVAIKKYSTPIKWITLVLFLFTVISIFNTGHKGGTLVYNYGAGVQLTTSTNNNVNTNENKNQMKESPNNKNEDDDD
ncbi:MAG: hypothetical protein STSR0008_23470 [Ignavibacterium sp.]